MPDPEQIQALVIDVLVIALLASPFVGLQRAATRRRLKRRSNGAVALASVGLLAAIGISSLLAPHASGALELLCPVGLVLANLAWLGFAVHTNREVSLRLAKRGASGPPTP